MISIGESVMPPASGFHTCAGAEVGFSSGRGSSAAAAAVALSIELESCATAALRTLDLAAARATASLASPATVSAGTEAWYCKEGKMTAPRAVAPTARAAASGSGCR